MDLIDKKREEILCCKNKEKVSYNLEKSLRILMNELVESLNIINICDWEKELEQKKIFLKDLKEYSPSLVILNEKIEELEEMIFHGKGKFIREELQLIILEKMSFLAESILKYSKIANTFFKIDLNVTVSLHFILIKRLNNVKSIVRNIFQSIPEFETLNIKKLKNLLKIVTTCHDFEGALEVVIYRTKIVSFLFKSIGDNPLSDAMGELADSVNQLIKLKEWDDSSIKKRLILPYKLIVDKTENIESYLRESYMRKKGHECLIETL